MGELLPCEWDIENAVTMSSIKLEKCFAEINETLHLINNTGSIARQSKIFHAHLRWILICFSR